MTHATSKARLILRALADGPATSTELADALTLERHFVRATLSNMYRSHCVTRTEFSRCGPGRITYLYEVSKLGMRKIGGAA